MRRSWSVVLLVGGLAIPASLYLPWKNAACGPGCFGGQAGTVSGLLNLFAGGSTLHGWSSGIGEIAALAGLLLAAVAAAAVARPSLAHRLPLGLCAMLAGYFALAVAAQSRSLADARDLGTTGIDLEFHWGYGAYLGVAAAVAVLLVAGAARRRDLMRVGSISGVAAVVLSLGLLVAFLLPWERRTTQAPITSLGIASPAAVVAASIAISLLSVWWGRSQFARAARPLLSGAALLFTAAAFSSVGFFSGARAYGAWVGLGAAIAITVLALTDGVPLPRVRPSWFAVATGAAAALLIAALFLPWQQVCFGRGFGSPLSERCLSTNGWTSPAGSVAALLAIALAAVAFRAKPLAALGVEPAAGLALFIATLGLQIDHSSEQGVTAGFGSGAPIGFVAAGILILLAVVRCRPTDVDWQRLLIRLAPLVVCLAYLAVVAVQWWNVFPPFGSSAWRFAPLSWLTIAGALLAIWLIGLWVDRIQDESRDPRVLVLIPLALLALATVDLVRLRENGFSWGRGGVVGFCLLLAALGRVEQQQGLEGFRVPAIFRVDRL